MIRRTAAITAASIAGVILAGGAAVGANIGILNAADDSNLGELSAQALPTTTVVTQAETSIPTILDSLASNDQQQSFTVDAAGQVDLVVDDSGISLAEVRPNQGWTWSESTTSDGSVVVEFSSGSDRLIFTATGNDDGTIAARVDRPASGSTQGTAPVATGPITTVPTTSDDGSYDDEYEYDDDDDDDDHEYEDHDDDDDDDDHEYEGHDDDD